MEKFTDIEIRALTAINLLEQYGAWFLAEKLKKIFFAELNIEPSKEERRAA